MNPYVMTSISQKGTPTYLRTVQHGKLNGFGKEKFATMTKTVFLQTDIINMTNKFNRLIQIKNIPNNSDCEHTMGQPLTIPPHKQ